MAVFRMPAATLRLETDLALGHRVVSLPAFNEHLDALQARRSADEPPRPSPGAVVPDALVELVGRALRQAPPRAGRRGTSALTTAAGSDPHVVGRWLEGPAAYVRLGCLQFGGDITQGGEPR